jgi:PAS domain S-box-containing protein
MTSILQEDGRYGAEAKAVLASPPFAPLAASGAPILLAVETPARVVAATDAALALFGVDAPEALTARIFAGNEPGARRLGELARSLLPGAAPRLERLRFFFGPIAEQVTVLCQRVAGAGEPVFVVAMLGVRPNLLRPARPSAPPTLRIVEAVTAGAASPDGAIEATVEAVEAAPVAAAPPPGPLTFEAARDALKQRYPAAAPVRFLWRTDADDRLVELSPPLAEVTGAQTDALIGEKLQDVATRLGLDAEGKLSSALAGRSTWSGIELLWPLAGAEAAVPATLGASPGFDRARAFTGYRGFGVLHVGRPAAQAARAAEPLATNPLAATPEAAPVDSSRPAESAPAPAPAVESRSVAPLVAPAAKVVAPLASLPTRIAFAAPAGNAPSQTEATPEPAPAHVARSVEQALEAADAITAAKPPAPPPVRVAFVAPIPVPRPAGLLPLTPAALPEGHPHAAPAEDIAARDADADPADALEAFGPESEEEAPVVAGVPVHESDLVEPIAAAEAVAAHPPAATDEAKVGAEAPATAEAPSAIEAAAIYESDLVGIEEATDDAARAGETAPVMARGDSVVVPLRPVAELPPGPAKLSSAELTPSERNAFREIARALGAKLDEPPAPAPVAAAVEPKAAPFAATPAPIVGGDARDLIALAGRAAGEAPTLGPALAGLEGPARALLDRMPLGVLVSRGATPIFANRFLLDLIGYADIDEFHAMGGMERMFKGRQPDQMGQDAGGAIPILTRGGDVTPAETHMQTLDWGGLPATLMTLRPTKEADLLPHVRSLEMELRKAEGDTRELHAILDTATDGVAVLDPAGRILALNRSAEALFGYDQNEVAGEPFTVLIARESHGAASDYLDGLKSNGVASVLNDGREVMGRARQGGAIPMFMTLGRVGAGETGKFCAVLRDLSQWKKAERELNEARAQAERASALKSDFLAKISHEIRTPLNAILGFAEVIMEERFGPVGNERYKDYLKDIHASGTHVMSLVNDLLDLSKIEAGKMDLNFGSVDANRIVSECVSLMQPQAARERVIVRLSLAQRLPNVVADERSLRQIVLNLLSNAVKFNEPGGQVIVSSALTDAGHAVIRIRDTGVGMSDEEVTTALEPFRQIATSRQTTGTGLGLPLTKALVEANRASFTIKSKKREGTLVEVAFPPTRVLAE